MTTPATIAVDHALALAEAGLYVFPVKPGEKTPAHRGWQAEATRDPAVISTWWPGPNNVGIATDKYGDGSEALLVVDIDQKPERNGRITVRQLEILGDEFPDTREHQTASGGVHVIYRVPQAVKQGANVLGKGVDIRSRGGYIVAPGSVIGTGSYKVSNSDPIAIAPAWLVERCGAPRERSPDATASVVPQPSADDRASDYLSSVAPAAEGGRNDTAYKIATRLRDFSCTQSDALALMAQHWNPRCNPPLDQDELAHVVASAYRYGREAPGIAAPENDFKPIVAPAATKPRLYFELFADVAPDLTKPALVERLLDHGAMTVLYGESNTGKTFVALDIAFSIASGTPWKGRAVKQGAVVYIAAEGGGHIRKRIAALRIHHELGSKPIPFALVPCSVDLSGRGADVQPLLDLIALVWCDTNLPVVLVIVDTLARALGGANENAPDDMGAFVANVDRIRAATKAHLLVVHHSGKDKAKGARGHSSLRAGTDTEIEIAENTITVTKQRDMELGPPIGFELLPVDIGRDASGRPVSSCVVIGSSVSAAEDFGPKHVRPGSVAGKALAVLQDLSPNGGNVEVAKWRDEFVQRYYPNSRKAGRTAFERGCEALDGANRLLREGDHASAIV